MSGGLPPIGARAAGATPGGPAGAVHAAGHRQPAVVFRDAQRPQRRAVRPRGRPPCGPAGHPCLRSGGLSRPLWELSPFLRANPFGVGVGDCVFLEMSQVQLGKKWSSI